MKKKQAFSCPVPHSQALQSPLHTHTHIPPFNRALFTVTKIWKQCKCPSMYGWIMKCMLFILNLSGYYLAIKKNESLPFATKWIDFKSTMLNKITQTEKHKYCIFSFICSIKKKKKKLIDRAHSGCQNWGWELGKIGERSQKVKKIFKRKENLKIINRVNDGHSVQFICSVMSDSLWPHGLQHTA